MRKNKLVFAVFFVTLFACTKEKREAILPSGGTSGPATLSSIQSDIFRLSCGTSGCHDNRANPAANLDLSSFSQSYAQMVNRNSSQVPSMKLVTPGDPSRSYLVNKLLDTHTSVGGSGVRMPQYAASLNASDLDRIQNWITDGAQPN